MSLGKKTLVLFLLLGSAICTGSYFALRITVLPTFNEFERQSSKDALTRVARVLEADLRSLEIMNIEYSAWDDTYEYATGRLPEYADDNLDPAYWHSIDINMMMIFDSDGRELFARIGHPDDGHELSLSEVFPSRNDSLTPLIMRASPAGSVLGLLSTDFGLMQVVSYPILTSEGEGPVAGTLIVGQFLTDERMLDIGERATVELSIDAITKTGLPTDVSGAFADRGDPAGKTALAVTAHHIRGFRILDDAFGNPAAVIEVRQPRTISQIGTHTIWTTTFLLAIGSLGFLLAALFFTHRLMVAPIRELTQKILDIQSTGNLEIDVSNARSDEVGVLASEFAELTAGLSKARDELERARDDALSLSNAKSEFLARMSHEIRTPMNGVLGMTELLRNTALNDKQKRFAATITESAESLLHIINDILDISKIEAGKLDLDIAPFNLRSVVEECLELLADNAHRKNIELIGSIPADMHVFVEGDALRLRQVLVNLLGNALKFTESGEIVVRISELKGNQEKTIYRFEVQDSGVGFDPRNLDRIFEPFTQEDGSTTRRFGGTGLGLSICKQLLNLMGGDIGAESRLGHGSTFWFTVPLVKDSAVSELPTPTDLAGKHVLIVDDNATNRETLQHQLENWHVRVASASSAAEALGVISSGIRNDMQFDAVLLDMNMPGMNGVQLAKEIRQSRRLESTPLIMLSSVSIGDAEHDPDDANINAWLTKPVRQTRLHEALVSHLCRTEAASQLADDQYPALEATNDTTNRSLRVLLAEDNKVNQIVTIGMLQELGHEVTVAENGIDAIETFKKRSFDLVFMDCQMPEMDGFEATRSIRRWEEEEQRAPSRIIALTADALTGDRERCLAAGMNDYVSKPFRLEHLAAVIASSMSQEEQAAARSTSSGASKSKILIVDDNAINQQVTSAMLSDLGYDAVVVADGDEALTAFESTKFDLILMDCHMPVRDGYDTTREIRRLESKSSDRVRVPIVALTADLMQNNRQRCLDSGMDDYVTKPFTQEQLRLVVSRWISTTTIEEEGPEFGVDTDGFTLAADTVSSASLDRQVLDEILQLDRSSAKNMVREIIVSYCATSTKLILQLRAAIADRDVAQIEVIAHSLKGCSGQMGAILLATLCEQILTAAKNNDLDAAPSLCERAAVEHSALIIALDKEMQRIAA